MTTTTREHGELTLQDSMPHILEFFPGIDDIGGEDSEYFAIHIWNGVAKDAREPISTEAEMVCSHALGLFGTFLVLHPGGAIPTADIQHILEQKSQAWSWEETSPPSPHTALLTTQEAGSKDAFFEALLNVLCKSEPTARDQVKQKLAAVLMARFFSGNPDKVLELASWISHEAKFGGRPNYWGD